MLRALRIRTLALLAVPIAGAPAAHAQQASDTTAATFFGDAVTYGELVREYASMRRLPDPEPTSDSDSPDAGIQRLEVDGLVVDQTLTKLGRDFYDIFFRNWEAPEDAINFTLVIQEQPAPGNGTIVTVLVDDEPSFQTRLQPKIEEIEAAAYQAVGVTRYRLSRRETPVIY